MQDVHPIGAGGQLDESAVLHRDDGRTRERLANQQLALADDRAAAVFVDAAEEQRARAVLGEADAEPAADAVAEGRRRSIAACELAIGVSQVNRATQRQRVGSLEHYVRLNSEEDGVGE